MLVQGPGPGSLSLIDTTWLRMDEPSNLMVIHVLVFFDGRVNVEDLSAVLNDRLTLAPRFRQRVVPGSFLSRPRWEDMVPFDARDHLENIELEGVTDDSQLEQVVGEIISRPLDKSRPLWSMHLLQGKPEGTVMLVRLHHCIGDGMALVRTMLSIADGGAPIRYRSPATRPSAQRSVPPVSVVGRIVRSLTEIGNVARAGKQKIELMWQSREEAKANLAFVGKAIPSLWHLATLPPDPKTHFRGPLHVEKCVAWSSPIPLADVKSMGKRIGGTVNDALMAVICGGLRRYLELHGEMDESLKLRAVVPVNLRPLDEEGGLGNYFGLVFFDLPIGVRDPVIRMQETRARMHDLKNSPEALVTLGMLFGLGALPSWIEGPALTWFGKKATAVMSNVPGPRDPLFFVGHRIRSMLFWVPQSGRLGLGISILSYAGTIRIGIMCDRGLVQDPQAIRDALDEEIRQLAQNEKPPRVEQDLPLQLVTP